MPTTRRQNLNTVYMHIVRNWAVEKADIVADTPDLDAKAITSLLNTLTRSGIIAKTNTSGMTLFQSFFDIENEEDVEERAQASFDEKFPNEVKETKTPTQVERRTLTGNEIVYTVRKTRVTGAHVMVQDNRNGEKDIPNFEGPQRWISICATHGTLAGWKTRVGEAEKHAHHPETWCTECDAIAHAK